MSTTKACCPSLFRLVSVTIEAQGLYVRDVVCASPGELVYVIDLPWSFWGTAVIALVVLAPEDLVLFGEDAAVWGFQARPEDGHRNGSGGLASVFERRLFCEVTG